jgi:glycosyltransferase involved in cell wall biosynthesis
LAAGPGIRYWQISRSLRADYGHRVTLAVPVEDFNGPAEGVDRSVGWDLDNVAELAAGHDCVVMPHVHSGLSTVYRQTADPALPTAVDLYDPVLIENIGLQPGNDEGADCFAGYLSGVVPALKRGDYFVCANERQRYYYLGVLNALGRINPLTYGDDILELVPFGVDDAAPIKTRSVMRGQVVDPDDRIILWFSGIYPWFDAYTLIEAMPAVLEQVPTAKLVIMGGRHPRAHAPDGEFLRTKKRAEQLKLTDSSVIFMDWQPYEDRANWYLESDLAVTTHKQSLETELSHRTRVIDFLWGGLPVITSTGDAVGEMLEARGCGLTVPPGDSRGLAEKIISVLDDQNKREEMCRLAKLTAGELTWKAVIRPLAEFCAAPRIAADRLRPESAVMTAIDTLEEHRRLSGESPGIWKKLRRRLR